MNSLTFVFLVLCTSLITMSQMVNCSSVEVQKEHDQWLQKFTTAQEKVTRLHFYLHNTPVASKPTTALVANGVNGSRTSFGALVIIDDVLTEGPKPTSKPVGRAQGLVGFCSLDEVLFCMSFNFVFTAGKFNGSSLAILGRNRNPNPAREMPIVGGTGAFRLARGFLTTTTFYQNSTTQNGIFDYNVVVIHY